MVNSLSNISRTTKIVLIVEFMLLAYMLYVLCTSLYKSYQVDVFIKQTEEENQKLERDNALLIEDYEYYKSAGYKEKIAKQNLGLVRPGEEVIVLAPEGKQYMTGEERALESNREYFKSLSYPRKWFLFFFDRERFSM